MKKLRKIELKLSTNILITLLGRSDCDLSVVGKGDELINTSMQFAYILMSNLDLDLSKHMRKIKKKLNKFIKDGTINDYEIRDAPFIEDGITFKVLLTIKGKNNENIYIKGFSKEDINSQIEPIIEKYIQHLNGNGDGIAEIHKDNTPVE